MVIHVQPARNLDKVLTYPYTTEDIIKTSEVQTYIDQSVTAVGSDISQSVDYAIK
jgi:hypothetical protein